jgi:adenylate kinase family enzyme
MRIAVIGPSGSGKTWLASRLANGLGIRHVELDALFHGPNWESCGPEVLRERVAEATAGDDWIADGTYHQMIGELVFERVDTVAWLDLPVSLVMWRLARRTYLRKKHQTELWHGNREIAWRESVRYLIWPAFKRGFENRRKLRVLFARHSRVKVYRLRSDGDVRKFLDSVETRRGPASSATLQDSDVSANCLARRGSGDVPGTPAVTLEPGAIPRRTEGGFRE